MKKTWYVMQCKPKKEDFVYKQLCAREIEAFYPKVKKKRANSRMCKFKPYFPGYLFVCVDFNQYQPAELKWLPGSINLVSIGDEPASVPSALIHAIRQKVDEINAAGNPTVEEQYKPGDPVIIQKGPFDGFRAIFDTRLSGTERVRVLLQGLHRQLLVDLPAECIRAKS
jgi:transcription elongation factor/antiterminator RfaH